MHAAAQIAGILLLAAMPLLLSLAWRRGPKGRAARYGGWVALAGALIAFSIAFGPPRGVALAFAILPLGALPVVGWRRDNRPARPPRDARGAAVPAGWSGSRMVGRIIVALPLAGTAAVLAAAGISSLCGTMTVGIVASLALVVLFWSAGMVWTVSDPSLLRPAAGLTLIAVAGGLCLAAL